MQADYCPCDIKSKCHHLNYHHNTEQFSLSHVCPFKKFVLKVDCESLWERYKFPPRLSL